MNAKHSISLLVIVIGSMFLFAIAFGAFAQDATPTPAAWGYEGEEGPANWGELDAAYVACSEGRAQSPIDLANPQSADLSPITYNYTNTALNLVNTGEGAKVTVDVGSNIVYNETEYQLLQFHFHAPSEHTLNGKSFPLELHLVHQSAAGDLAVVGVLLMAGEADNAVFAPIFDNLPGEVNVPIIVQDTFTAADLLPTEQTYFTYTGSLTTPPCSQGVRWLVLTGTQTISEAQIAAFHEIVEMNARPTQPLNLRDLLLDSAP